MKRKEEQYSIKNKNIPPYWITGFSNDESNFTIRIAKYNIRKQCWRIKSIFNIEMHKKDLIILKKIQNYFGVGNSIFRNRNNNVIYSVQSLKDINNAIIPPFKRYTLLT